MAVIVRDGQFILDGGPEPTGTRKTLDAPEGSVSMDESDRKFLMGTRRLLGLPVSPNLSPATFKSAPTVNPGTETLKPVEPAGRVVPLSKNAARRLREFDVARMQSVLKKAMDKRGSSDDPISLEEFAKMIEPYFDDDDEGTVLP